MMEKDTVNKKRDFGQKLQDFMASYRGKVIMNYAYSWGAAIVIAGTLFKLTHLPGANLMLWIGMGTEVLVFFISAFDLPRRQSGLHGWRKTLVPVPFQPDAHRDDWKATAKELR